MELIIAAISGSQILGLLLQVVIVGVIVWVLFWGLGKIGLPEPFNKIATVLIVILACVFVINALLSLMGSGFIRW